MAFVAAYPYSSVYIYPAFKIGFTRRLILLEGRQLQKDITHLVRENLMRVPISQQDIRAKFVS